MKKKITIIALFIFCATKYIYTQNNSHNGYCIPTKGNLHCLIIFAEVDYGDEHPCSGSPELENPEERNYTEYPPTDNSWNSWPYEMIDGEARSQVPGWAPLLFNHEFHVK